MTFSALYMFTENFILPFSHDEVVHGKGALLDKMPGDVWQKYATLRALYGFMYAHPGKKLLFMGGEFGQWREWNHDRSLDWHLLDDPAHAGLHRYVQALNWHYRAEPALHESDFDPSGFRWIDCNDNENSVISFLRCARIHGEFVVTVFNFTPVPRAEYRIGVPEPGFYAELLNSDSRRVRRQQRRQRRRRAERAGRRARLRPLAPPDAAAARRVSSEEARVSTTSWLSQARNHESTNDVFRRFRRVAVLISCR